MSASIDPVANQTMGQPFFRHYMAKYPEVFQQWVLAELGLEYTLSFQDRHFPHLSEVPRGYEIDKEPTRKGKTPNEDSYEPADGWICNDDFPTEHDFTYYANIRSKGKPTFQGTYIQFKLIAENSTDLTFQMFNDYSQFVIRTYVEKLKQVVMYIGDYPFHTPTKMNGQDLKMTFSFIDLTQLPLDKVTSYPDFHVQLLAMFNHQMPEVEKVNCMVAGMMHVYHEKGIEDAEYYYHLLELTETAKNSPALDQVFAQLATTPEYQPFQRKALTKFPHTMDEAELKIMQVIIDKTIKYMYKRNEDALEAARALDLNPAEFQALLNRVEANGGVVKAEKPHLR
jgi:hypothetical protein